MNSGYPAVLAEKEFTARGFPTAFSAVFAGRRFRAFTALRVLAAFLPFFDFALTVGAPPFALWVSRTHFLVPRALA